MVNSFRRRAAKVLKGLGYAVFLLLSVWGLLELAYRYQWIDFYADELRGLNPATVLETSGGRTTVLLLGDSFSAQPRSYIDLLRDSMPGVVFVNAAAPGTGILEAAVIARERLLRFPPDLLVYQVYVGNDLWDIGKTYDSPRISTARQWYWRLADYSLFLRFFNYKLGQFKSRAGVATETRELKKDIPFSPDLYSKREKLIFQAEPDLIQNSVLAEGKRGADVGVWLKKMENMLALLPGRTRQVVILVIPHCAQVNDFYTRNLSAIGAAPFPVTIQHTDYPFLKQLEQHFSGDPRVRVFSPLPVFQQQDSTGHRLYYENDPHLNAAGHLLLGQALKPVLANIAAEQILKNN